MKLAVDLHIHTGLSPCSDNEMTPNNIVNMALLKGLDAIAITDHNTAENIKAVAKCAENTKLLFVPGMEVETREEVHLVCLFKSVEEALKMQEIVYAALPDIENREDIFGQQIIMDEEDNIKGYLKRLLVTATNLSIEDVFDKVGELGGVVIPAHIDRESYSVLSNLGMVPENLGTKYMEVSRNCMEEEFLRKNPDIRNYKFIKSSDAHHLVDLLERESFIEVEEVSLSGLIRALNK